MAWHAGSWTLVYMTEHWFKLMGFGGLQPQANAGSRAGPTTGFSNCGEFLSFPNLGFKTNLKCLYTFYVHSSTYLWNESDIHSSSSLKGDTNLCFIGFCTGCPGATASGSQTRVPQPPSLFCIECVAALAALRGHAGLSASRHDGRRPETSGTAGSLRAERGSPAKQPPHCSQSRGTKTWHLGLDLEKVLKPKMPGTKLLLFNKHAFFSETFFFRNL